MSEAQQPLSALPSGYRLQEYELVRVLGFGGFGMTYLALDDNLNKAVAIKEYLPSDLATRTADGSVAPQASNMRGDFDWGLERFVKEAQILARFDHRHIVKVHRYFEAHGTAYIVMEYAEGETLAEFLGRKGTLEEAELKGILYPLLNGLAAVHEAGILHRDIKPLNIVIRDEDDSPVLLDFGAARQAIGAKSRSITSVVTPGYAPIEQYSSRGHQGAWTDIYALGAVCYRALTGEVPEDATDRVLNDSLVAVSQRCADPARGAFLSAIDAALLVNGADRPQSVAEWREALGADGGQAQEQAADPAEASQSQEKPLLSAIDVALAVDEEARPPSVAEQVPKRADGAEVQQDKADAPPSVRRVEPAAPPSPPQKTSLRKRLAVGLGIIAVLVGGKMYVDHAEQVALEQQRQEQAAEEARLAAEQEEQRREQAALEKQRREQAALDKQRREEQAALDKQRREEQAVLKEAGVDNLHDAASKDAYEAAEVLLRQGADVHAKNDDGYTPLHVVARNNSSATAEVLIKHGANVNSRRDLFSRYGDDDGCMPLHEAARNNSSATAEVLIKHGANVNAKDHWNMQGGRAVMLFGGTPLHWAGYADASATAEVLLRHGADVHAKDKLGWTPLHEAAWSNSSATAEVLIKHGADIQAKNEAGYLEMEAGWTPLHWAGYVDASATAEVLLRHGADVHAKTNDGCMPLHVAAWNDASATAEVLLKQGAKVNAKDTKGRTPLHLAAEKNASATAEVLRRYGSRK